MDYHGISLKKATLWGYRLKIPGGIEQMKAFIVWNEAKTEGFVTTEAQLAYEVRKGSDSNCYTEEGRRSTVGAEFCEAWLDDNCTIEEIEVAEAAPTERIKDIEEIRLAMTVECPICKADIGCACDQFLAPHPLPFTVHVERLGAALAD